jgi:membrane dipeptidase
MTSTAPDRETDIGARAARLVDSSFVLDGTQVFRTGGPGKPKLPLGDTPLDGALIEEWRSAGVDAFIHPCAIMAADMHLGQVQTLGRWNAFIADHTESLQRIDAAEDFDRIRATGKIGVLIGSHHGEPFRTVDDVDYFAGLGLRSCIPVTFGQNRLGAAVDEPAGGGLTGYGRAVVARMNQAGMAVDVSHCNERTRLDAIEVSAKPVLMSHANAYARCANVRNASDAVIRALAARGGVMGIMPLRMLLTAEEPTGLDDFIDHIAYVSDLVGPAHVGMGLETPPEGFDSIPGANQIPLPSYLRNAGVQRKLDLPELCQIRRLYTIVEALLRRGFSDADIAGFIGANFERALRDILTV